MAQNKMLDILFKKLAKWYKRSNFSRPLMCRFTLVFFQIEYCMERKMKPTEAMTSGLTLQIWL